MAILYRIDTREDLGTARPAGAGPGPLLMVQSGVEPRLDREGSAWSDECSRASMNRTTR